MTNPVLKTPSGCVRGMTESGVEVFRGLPYAEPPVGSLRFLPPVAVQPWNGVRDGITFGLAAVQPWDVSVALTPAQMGEDCLTLNVWKPATTGLHPVLVWVHGGGQTIGSPLRPEYDGASFARQGIVCVTVGYRLGVFGFLELGELLGERYSGSGNNGLKDIQLALKWVQSHIACFGGDPSQVTLGGESAGAKNVAALMGAEGSAGLFHKVVMFSGGSHTTHSVQSAQALASQMVVQGGPMTAKALLDAPASVLLKEQEMAIQNHPVKFAFRPVIDGEFLRDPLIRKIQTRSLHPLPALIGTCRDESALFMDLNAPLSPLSSRELAHLSVAQMAEIRVRYAEEFPKLPELEMRVRMLTAEEYWIPSIRLAEALAESCAPVWVCRFDYENSTGVRPMHVSDLRYWWKWGGRVGSFKLSGRPKLGILYARFARGLHLRIDIRSDFDLINIDVNVPSRHLYGRVTRLRIQRLCTGTRCHKFWSTWTMRSGKYGYLYFDAVILPADGALSHRSAS